MGTGHTEPGRLSINTPGKAAEDTPPKWETQMVPQDSWLSPSPLLTLMVIQRVNQQMKDTFFCLPPQPISGTLPFKYILEIILNSEDTEE